MGATCVSARRATPTELAATVRTLQVHRQQAVRAGDKFRVQTLNEQLRRSGEMWRAPSAAAFLKSDVARRGDDAFVTFGADPDDFWTAELLAWAKHHGGRSFVFAYSSTDGLSVSSLRPSETVAVTLEHIGPLTLRELIRIKPTELVVHRCGLLAPDIATAAVAFPVRVLGMFGCAATQAVGRRLASVLAEALDRGWDCADLSVDAARFGHYFLLGSIARGARLTVLELVNMRGAPSAKYAHAASSVAARVNKVLVRTGAFTRVVLDQSSWQIAHRRAANQLLAMRGAPITTPAGRFAFRDGDLAISFRVLAMLMDPGFFEDDVQCVMQRTDASFESACHALARSGGSVPDAIFSLFIS